MAPSRGTRARAMKSVKKMLGKGGGGGGGSGKGNEPAAWEDFSAFTNTAPIAPGGGGGGGGGRRHDAMAMGAGARASSIEDAEGPHPLTKAWAGRIKNAKVRAAFMDEPIAGYTSARDLKVLCGTWNTNGKSPPADLDVSRWLDASSRPDVVVVGFQEIVPLTAGKVLAVEDDKATREWEAIIERALNDAATTATTTAAAAAAPKNAAAFASDTSWQRAGQPPRTQTPQSAAGWTSFDSPGVSGGGGGWTSFDAPAFPGAAAAAAGRDRYIRLASKQLVGVYITVYVNASTAEHTRDVRVHTVSTGFNIGLNLGGFKTPDITLGNKGGAAVWMRVYSTPIVFICSHLSAGSKEGDAEKRSADFGEIVTKLSFPAPPSASSDGVAEKPAGVADAHAAVWLGDLNYRLNLPDDRVRAAIASGNCASLLGSDQLLLERAAGKAFVGWIEAPVTFPPTYKYRPGTNTYSGAGDAGAEDENGGGGENGDAGGARVKVSAKEEKKKRTPAWCDRILWRGRDIRQNSYARAELTQSDHKPVLAEFTIVARELQPERLQETLDSLRRRLDAEEAASQPRCTLENPQADFGDLKHGETKAISFRLVNSGDVPARWGFVPGGARGAAARAGGAAVARPRADGRAAPSGRRGGDSRERVRHERHAARVRVVAAGGERGRRCRRDGEGTRRRGRRRRRRRRAGDEIETGGKVPGAGGVDRGGCAHRRRARGRRWSRDADRGRRREVWRAVSVRAAAGRRRARGPARRDVRAPGSAERGARRDFDLAHRRRARFLPVRGGEVHPREQQRVAGRCWGGDRDVRRRRRREPCEWRFVRAFDHAESHRFLARQFY